MKFKLIIVIIVLALVILACGKSNESTQVPDTNQAPQAVVDDTKAPETVATKRPTNTAQPTKTKMPTLTPIPTATPDPNLVSEGTYLVGKDIQPGLYKGMAGTGIFESCYWQRSKDLTGSFGSILANDNAEGQFYIQVYESDFALETGCPLVYMEEIPQVSPYPTTIEAGTYLVGYDIKPGTYQGKAGTDVLESCYWQRSKDLSGDIYSILANDNANGQYYVQVLATDYALKTGCPLDWISD